MPTVLASLRWTPLSATLLSAMLLTEEGRQTRFLPAAAIVAAGYAALALWAIRPGRAILRQRLTRRRQPSASRPKPPAVPATPPAAASALADRT